MEAPPSQRSAGHSNHVYGVPTLRPALLSTPAGAGSEHTQRSRAACWSSEEQSGEGWWQGWGYDAVGRFTLCLPGTVTTAHPEAAVRATPWWEGKVTPLGDGRGSEVELRWSVVWVPVRTV